MPHPCTCLTKGQEVTLVLVLTVMQLQDEYIFICSLD